MENVNFRTPRTVTKTAPAMFVIDVNRSRVNFRLLSDTLSSLRDTYCSLFAGYGTKDGQLLEHCYLCVEFSNPNHTYPDDAYRVSDFVCFLQKLGLDVREEDVSVSFSQRRSEKEPSEETPFPDCDEDDMAIVGKEGADHHIRDDVQHQSNESLRKETQHG